MTTFWLVLGGGALFSILAALFMGRFIGGDTNSDERIVSTCTVCRTGIHWIVCPTGGWWAHDIHPADDHDAESAVEVIEEMDDHGRWITIGVGGGRG